MEHTVDTAVVAASTRRASLNGALARAIADRLQARGERVDLIDLSRFDMPMYHGDLEADEGVPPAATELAERLAGARRLVITSPEYNGSYPALLKNTVDWLTRVDRSVLAHLEIHLAAASPGRMGGTRGLAHLRTWLESMRLSVAEADLSVPHATLDDQGRITADQAIDVDAFLPAVS
jgi:NAD(P)H-dependent FMN reductase